MIDKKKAEGILFDKKVRIMPIPRGGAMIDDPKHIGFFMYNDTKRRYVLPKSRSRRTLYPLLTATEQEFFEGVLGIDLNVYAKEDNFWHTFEVVIEKNDAIMKNGITLDLSDPMDNLKWRLLKIQEEIAPSWEQRYDSGAYKFALVEEDHEEAEQISKTVMESKAYQHLAKIENSLEKMQAFLTIYHLQNPKSKRIAPDADRDGLYADCGALIKNDLKGFLAVANDKEYDMKLLVHKAIACGAIEKKVSSKDYYTPEMKFLGNNLDQVIKNLRTDEYQEDYMKIKAVVEVSSENKK